MKSNPRYPVILRPLSDDDGGGWVAIVPDLPGCMSDGRTGDEAFRNVLDAIEAWEASVQEDGRPAPLPDSFLAMMHYNLPPHLKPQLDDLVRQMEESQSDHVSRDQIIAGLMLQLIR